MRDYLNRLPEEIKDLIYLARDIAAKNNISAYLVGGFVRDLILGVKNLDLDIVIEGDGINFAEFYALALKAKLIRHRRFGTATIILNPNLKIDPSTSLRVNGERSRTIDVATARKEFYPEPGCLPVVAGGNLRDDLARRDFSINAMAIGISRMNFGKLIDFFHGKTDLYHKKIRVLHNLSFIDDPTRILRAIRFEKRYNFRIDLKTLQYLKEAKRLKALEKVQAQRLRDELILMFKETHPIQQIKRLQELVGLGFINPGLALSKKTYNLLLSIEKQIGWFREKFPRHRKLDTWLIYFMGLIDSIDISAVKAICSNFVFRKGEEKRMLSYKKISHQAIQELSQKKIRPSRIFALLEPLSYETIILLRAKSKNYNLKRHIEDFFEIYNGMRICISGDDLRRLGVIPGPYYQKIFAKVLNAKLNGSVRTQEEELALIKKIISKATLDT